MTITYGDIGRLYPDLLRQVLDGESEHTYNLSSGKMTVRYIKKDGKLEREAYSVGSLDVAMTVSRVSNFFNDFPFQDYYSLESSKVKDCLVHAFQLIISRAKESTLSLSDGSNIKVSLEYGRLYFNGVRRDSLSPEDSEIADKIEAFISIPCLRDFTSNTYFYPMCPRIY